MSENELDAAILAAGYDAITEEAMEVVASYDPVTNRLKELIALLLDRGDLVLLDGLHGERILAVSKPGENLA
jgi:hypothetical protein